MNTRSAPSPSTRLQRWQAWARHYLPDMASFAVALVFAGLAALLASVLSGCGGGVGTEGTGSYASGSYGSGTITGFGSVIVNGVHFDETAAVVKDDDGTSLAATDLALGMVVQINGGPITTAGSVSSAVASSIQASRALVGPVSAVDVANSRMTVLGQTVVISSSTVFDTRIAGGLALALQGQVVAVYGYFDSATQSYSATRVALASGAAYRVSGPVSSIDNVAHTCKIAGQTYAFDPATTIGSATTGSVLRVNVQGAPDTSGRWVINGGRGDDKPPNDQSGAAIEGVIAAVSGTRLVVAGATVETSTAVVQGSLVVGARVQASGQLVAGVLVASQVQVDSNSGKQFEVSGTLSGLDTVAKTFVVRGTVVSYAAPGVVFKNGTAANLVGYAGKIKANGALSSGGTILLATQIEFSN